MNINSTQTLEIAILNNIIKVSQPKFDLNKIVLFLIIFVQI